MPRYGLSRSLGLTQTTAIVVGIIIGSSIFVHATRYPRIFHAFRGSRA